MSRTAQRKKRNLMIKKKAGCIYGNKVFLYEIPVVKNDSLFHPPRNDGSFIERDEK